MTALDTRPDTVEEWEPELSAPVPTDDGGSDGAPPSSPPMTPGRVILIVAVWLVVTFLAMMLVAYGLEPLFQERTQDQLLASYRQKVAFASNETGGLGGVSTPVLAPELGSPVAILEIGRLQLQQVVVEGAQPSQTQTGPGHIPGTAGPGQPGNSAIVGRRGTFGAPFRDLDKLEPDDPILVTTTQGQSVYKVVSVQTQRIVPAAVDGAASASTPDSTSTTEVTTTSTAEPTAGSTTATTVAPLAVPESDRISVDELYGITTDDRLTLVTSASASPRNATDAVVVVAQLEGVAFTPTPQGGRTRSQSGLAGDSGAWPAFALAMVGFSAAAVAAVVAYRRSTIRIAYLLTTPPLVAFIVLGAEAFSRFFPAWM